MAEILFLTDLHIKISSFQELDKLDCYLTEWFNNNRVDAIVVGGDTLDTHEKICSFALNKACAFIKKLCERQHVYILVGNHDYINNSQYMTDAHWLNALKEWPRVTVVDETTERDIAGERYAFVPYTPPGCFSRAVSRLEKTPSVIFAHQEFNGCKMGAIKSQSEDVWSGDCPIVSGHIHEAQTVGDVIYPGSSLCHATSLVSNGPCVVHDGAVRYIGFKSKKHVKEIFAPTTLTEDDKRAQVLKVRGTRAELAQLKYNPALGQIISRIKFMPSEGKIYTHWEEHIVENLTTRAMKDDYAEIVSMLK